MTIIFKNIIMSKLANQEMIDKKGKNIIYQSDVKLLYMK
jgi:hypothetical protein